MPSFHGADFTLIHARITMMQETPSLINIPQRVSFMRRIHLFYRLEDENFATVAGSAIEQVYEAGDVIVHQGDVGNSFYMIYSGSVNLVREKPTGGETRARLVEGDYFGEEPLRARWNHDSTVTAAEKTVLLVLDDAEFNALLKKLRQLKSNFDVAVNSHRLARKMHFKWLREEEGEVIYFLARKHPILLLRGLLFPVIFASIGLVGTAFGYTANFPWLLWPSVAILGFSISWGLWKGLDWGNDYYIVTNQRVVWLEKVIGVYDSRQEAPLSVIQRINVQVEFWGQQLDYGTVILRTIVGTTLTLHNVNHPYQVAALIEEHWKRTRHSSRKVEEDAMLQALEDRLVLNKVSEEPEPSLLQQQEPQKKKQPFGTSGFGLSRFFRVRFEDLSTITYRKHWVVLIEKIWIPTLLLLGLLGWLLYQIVHISIKNIPIVFQNSGAYGLLVVWLLLFFMLFVWWYYQYLDWGNDIFQVTPDQILDIYKKPLGEVSSDIASLDNILHLEYERKGILQVIFNYGNVYITIGGGKDMIFEDLYNPSAVQDDIERRRLEHATNIEKDRIKGDRERMADWFAAYHQHKSEYPQDGPIGMGPDEDEEFFTSYDENEPEAETMPDDYEDDGYFG